MWKIYSKFMIIDIPIGAPLRQADLADCIISVQGESVTDLRLGFGLRDVQIIRNQITTDQKLIQLVTTMESIYTFVDAIQSNVSEHINLLEETIKRIFNQTIECAIFIREYVNHGFLGNSAGRATYVLSNRLICCR